MAEKLLRGEGSIPERAGEPKVASLSASPGTLHGGLSPRVRGNLTPLYSHIVGIIPRSIPARAGEPF